MVGCTLRFDRKHQVLLITFGKLATQASALATYSAVERFVAAEGPCSVIADLSLLEKVEVPGHFVRSMDAWAMGSPARGLDPPGCSREQEAPGVRIGPYRNAN